MSDETATGGAGELAAGLATAAGRHVGGEPRVVELRRLSGGASAETWSFDLELGDETRPLILRRRIAGGDSTSIGPEAEAGLQRLAEAAGVPVAHVLFVLEPEDALGRGYVMERLDGESLAPRILRDEQLAGARQRLAFQCGEILARLHSVEPSAVSSGVEPFGARAQLERYREIHDSFADPHPVFEVAFRFLEEGLAASEPEPRLVHGDFRNGNLLVGPDGVRAVLDWELAHLGDPMEDLGWLCVPSWRFGRIDQPVGGFGRRDELFAGYRAAGGVEVDPERVRWWEVLGSLKWGIMCQIQGFAHLHGHVRSVEKAAIGRRASETEIDLLDLIEGREE